MKLSVEDKIFAMVPDQYKQMYISEMAGRRKRASTAFLLALFLGGIGAHHFYCGNYFLGVFALLFCWTFIPVVLALLECVLTLPRLYVESANEGIAREIAKKYIGLTMANPKGMGIVEASPETNAPKLLTSASNDETLEVNY